SERLSTALALSIKRRARFMLPCSTRIVTSAPGGPCTAFSIRIRKYENDAISFVIPTMPNLNWWPPLPISYGVGTSPSCLDRPRESITSCTSSSSSSVATGLFVLRPLPAQRPRTGEVQKDRWATHEPLGKNRRIGRSSGTDAAAAVVRSDGNNSPIGSAGGDEASYPLFGTGFCCSATCLPFIILIACLRW